MSLQIDYRPYRAAYIGPRYSPAKRRPHYLDRTEYNGMRHDYPRPHYRRELLPVVESPLKGETIRRIIARVAYAYGYTPEELFSQAKPANLVMARFAAIWAVHSRFPDLHVTRIGKYFQRDRTTILSAIARASSLTKTGALPDPTPKLFPGRA